MRGDRSSDWRPYQELCGTSDRQPLETCSRPQWQRISSPCAGPVLMQVSVITLNKPATGPGIQILLHFRRGFVTAHRQAGNPGDVQAAASGHTVKRLADIGDDVVNVLDTNRYPNKVRADARGRQLVSIQLPVSRGSRMAGQ